MLLITAIISYWGKKDMGQTLKSPLSDAQKKISTDITHLTADSPAIYFYDSSIMYADEFSIENNGVKKNTTVNYNRLSEANFYNGGNAGN